MTEFNYRYTDGSDAQIFVGVQTSGVEGERVQLVEGLEEQGYPVMDLTDNEVAKLHV
ncbi:hypothetical protein [Oleiphilus sp. HI0125]|uniref:hypothetical protein n=1 Tax=Oleiphilus sp. HI0125 TaxID=1822266 RepID=UPI00210188A8|nr:hypothetical protein [Oleiphilus sp. HI0125]